MAGSGFVKATSGNLPAVDVLMVAEFMKRDKRFNIAEVRGSKAANILELKFKEDFKQELCTFKNLLKPQDFVIFGAYDIEVDKTHGLCSLIEEKINLYRDIQQSDASKEAIIELRNVVTFFGEGICYNNINIKNQVSLNHLEYSFEEPNVKEEVQRLNSSEQGELERMEIYRYELCHYQARRRKNLKKTLVGSQGYFRSANL
ncbi:hypothetical protein NQ317_011227 [Molorchus minor]|uniref:Uncharacterized protein n=1 Tax=Molorchus minor TaxID=1323400 RepID=A0ABQ9IXG4_9CUCU|nr:hypothetical protein NQ317_011227 [Molorchus minor]